MTASCMTCIYSQLTKEQYPCSECYYDNNGNPSKHGGDNRRNRPPTAESNTSQQWTATQRPKRNAQQRGIENRRCKRSPSPDVAVHGAFYPGLLLDRGLVVGVDVVV